MDDAIPVAKRLICVFKDRPGDDGESIAIRRTCPTLPMEGLVRRCIIKVGIAATRAMNAIGPTARDKICATRGLIGEQFFELCRRKLMDWLWLLGSGHGVLPAMEGYWHA